MRDLSSLSAKCEEDILTFHFLCDKTSLNHNIE